MPNQNPQFTIICDIMGTQLPGNFSTEVAAVAAAKKANWAVYKTEKGIACICVQGKAHLVKLEASGLVTLAGSPL
jgi:hypothetical protein